MKAIIIIYKCSYFYSLCQFLAMTYFFIHMFCISRSEFFILGCNYKAILSNLKGGNCNK